MGSIVLPMVTIQFVFGKGCFKCDKISPRGKNALLLAVKIPALASHTIVTGELHDTVPNRHTIVTDDLGN